MLMAMIPMPRIGSAPSVTLALTLKLAKTIAMMTIATMMIPMPVTGSTLVADLALVTCSALVTMLVPIRPLESHLSRRRPPYAVDRTGAAEAAMVSGFSLPASAHGTGSSADEATSPLSPLCSLQVACQ